MHASFCRPFRNGPYIFGPQTNRPLICARQKAELRTRNSKNVHDCRALKNNKHVYLGHYVNRANRGNFDPRPVDMINGGSLNRK